MLVKLSSKEAQIAAEKYYLVYEFLESRGLDCDRYYDAVLDGFLTAVESYCQYETQVSFKETAFKEMVKACKEALSSAESEDVLLCSLDDCLENGLPIEKAVADTIDVAREVINSIHFEETMQSFNMSERRIAELLLAGYTERSIAQMLDMNLLTVFNGINSIYAKLTGGQMAMVA